MILLYLIVLPILCYASNDSLYLLNNPYHNLNTTSVNYNKVCTRFSDSAL